MLGHIESDIIIFPEGEMRCSGLSEPSVVSGSLDSTFVYLSIV